VGFRPQLVVVLGISVGIPLTVGFRPQLVVVSGLSVGILLTVILGFYGASGYHEAFSQTLPLSRWNFGYRRAFHEFFFHTMEFWLSRSLLMNFYFSRRNFGYQGAFHTNFFLFHDGILTIKEPFHEFLFHTMEFWL
jgi:hypothetical protein